VLDQQQWVQKQSGHFVAGGILALPRNIGRPNTLIVYSGDAQAFEQHRSTLASLAGSSQYLGADLGTAIGAYFTLGTFIMGVQSLFFETAVLARQYGVSMNSYYPLVRLVTDHVDETIRDGAHRVLTGHFDDSQASIGLWLTYMQDVAKTFDRTGIPAKMTDAIVEQLTLGMTRGDGDQDVARITESLWACRNTNS
jgi:3-hydroxyisobutyrate dehydrogenase-like beta-hydroxyacid dehydrogenase